MDAHCGCCLSACVGRSYTALVHKIKEYWCLDSGKWKKDEERLAVGLTDGVAPSDVTPLWQIKRQQHFPLALTDIGISFDCMQGEASVPEDEQRIKAAIQGESQLLDGTVHGAVAGSVLSRALQDENRSQQYLAAIREGEPMRQVSVYGDVADGTVALLVDSLVVVGYESFM